MPEITIRLANIAVDPEERADLTSLDPQEAEGRLNELYAFLPQPVTVMLEGTAVTIRIPEPEQRGDKWFEKTLDRATREANRGRYPRAIWLFEQLVEAAPLNVDVRRNLGMTYLESGDDHGPLKPAGGRQLSNED